VSAGARSGGQDGDQVAALPPERGNEPRRRLRAPRFVLALPAWIWFAFFFAIPVLFIFWYSFGNKPNIFSPIALRDLNLPLGISFKVPSGLSLKQYREVLDPTFFGVFRTTLRISITGTILCLLIGFPFAYWLAVRVSSKWKGLLLGLCIVPFWTNFLIRTIGWLIILSPEGPMNRFLVGRGWIAEPFQILDTRAAVQLGVVYNYLPLMIFPLFVALDRLDPALREASKDLGANRWRTLRQVTIPLAAPGIIAGLLLVFIPLTGDYITASVLGGAKGHMVGNLVAEQFLNAQNWAKGSAAAVVLIAMILSTLVAFAVVAMVLRALGRARRRITIPQPADGMAPA
jgi:spermidine/putrescine transport system permease protein